MDNSQEACTHVFGLQGAIVHICSQSLAPARSSRTVHPSAEGLGQLLQLLAYALARIKLVRTCAGVMPV